MVLRPVCERTAAAIRYYAQFTEVMFGKDADGASVNVPKTSSLSDYDGFLARTAPHRTAPHRTATARNGPQRLAVLFWM